MNVTELPELPAIVEGLVRHERRAALPTAFEHRAYLWLVDVDSLPDHGALARFDARDHLGSPEATLRENVERFVRAQGEHASLGRIVMLAAARVAGYVFDPLSVFWCFGTDGRLVCVVAEVHNTYGERDAYLLHLAEDGRTSVDKRFYVSPFFDVTGRYEMTFSLTRSAVAVQIDLVQGASEADGEVPNRVFSASFGGTPHVATARRVRSIAWRQPLMPQRVTVLIRLHGVALWARRLPLVTRPAHVPAAGVRADSVPDERPLWDRVPAAPRHPVRERLARRLVTTAARRAGVDLAFVATIPERNNTPAADEAAHGPVLHLTSRAVARLAAHPKLGLADGYIAGDWEAAPGTDLADALVPFAARFTAVLPAWAWPLRRLTDVALPAATKNTRRGSRRNIEAHYDLSNELFERFLDDTLSYSSALFDPAQPDESLTVAQQRKLDAVLDLAGVTSGTQLLEIGSGWGSLALRAAERGAEVVSITLSSDQLSVAERRRAASDAGERVEFRLQDYRDVDGRYDAVVSVEMVEAVGEEYWPEYLRVIHDRLLPGGRAVLQAITMPDDRMLATRNSHGWIQEYIFPGGLLPSVDGLRRAAGDLPLTMTSERSFGADYARTLRRWRERFEGEWPRVAELGFSENFHRMWRLYLAYCEAGFAAGYIDVEHLLVKRTK